MLLPGIGHIARRDRRGKGVRLHGHAHLHGIGKLRLARSLAVEAIDEEHRVDLDDVVLWLPGDGRSGG